MNLALQQTYNSEGKTSLLKVGESHSYHNGECNKTIANDFQIVENMRSVITEQMMNPFSCSNKIDLINIPTGHKASTTDSIMRGKEKSIASIRT